MIKNKKIILIGLIILSFFSIVAVSLAIEYTPLEGNALTLGGKTSYGGGLSVFLSQVFSFGIAAAVALALIMIIWGGIIKMTTDSWQGKDEAREKIENAVYGLGLVLISWLLLYTINPTLVNFSGNTLINPPKNTFNLRQDKPKPKIAVTSTTTTQVLLQQAQASGQAATPEQFTAVKLNFINDVNSIVSVPELNASIVEASFNSSSRGSGRQEGYVKFNSNADGNNSEKVWDLNRALIKKGYTPFKIQAPIELCGRLPAGCEGVTGLEFTKLWVMEK